MQFFSRVAVTALFLLISPQIAAAATPLNLQEAVAYAMAHNSAIAAKTAAVANAQSILTKQRAAELPGITGTLQNQLSRTSNSGGGFAQYGITPQSKFSQNTAQVGAQWMLYNGSLNQILAQEDKRQLESARADLRQTEAQTTANVAASFYGVASKENAARIAQSNLLYQQSLLSVAQAKEKAGLIAGVDVLRAEVAVQQGLATNIGSQSEVQTARENLAQTIGAALDTEFATSANVPEPALPARSLAALVGIAEQNRPDVAVSVANLALARLSRSAIDTDLRPQISLIGSFGNQYSPTSAASQQNQIDAQNRFCIANPASIQCAGAPFANITRGSPGFWQIGATSVFSVPIIDYGTRRAAHLAGNASIHSAELALTGAQNAAEADVRQSLRGAQTALASLGFQKKAAALAVESARIAQLQYKNGLISLTDVTAAQNTANAAQTDLFNARVGYINALIKLRSALGIFDAAATVSDL
ncbi:MAG: hypothetical protein NVSMB31_08870 [Vulcanimicrobiaceae bacterium]